MSTKTNFKRVALVAVAALGLGVLTSVAPANAAEGDTTVLSVSGQVVAPTITANVGTGTITANGSISFNAAAVSSIFTVLRVSGGTFTSITSGGSIGATNTSAVNSAANTALAGVVAVPTGAGRNMVVKSYTGASASAALADTSAVDTWTITVVAKGASGTFSLSDSKISITDDNTTTALAADEPYAYIVAAGSYGVISYELNDALTADMDSTTLVQGVVSSGACVIGTSTTNGVTTMAVGDAPNDILYVTQADYINTPPANCAVDILVDGVKVTSKTFTFQGPITSLEVSSIGRGKTSTANTGMGYLVAKDAAGNSVGNVTVTGEIVNANDAAVVSAVSVAAVTTRRSASLNSGTAPASTPVTVGWTCTATSSEGVMIKFKTSNGLGGYIYSPEYKAACGGDPVNYTAGFDKASYVPGDIATLTITGKDSKGVLTNDAATVGTVTTYEVSIAGSNMTAVAAPTNADTFTTGVKTYKFIVGATEGSYQMVVNLPKYNSTTYSQAALAVSYKIASGSTAVSNADVLKAIVSLIASINKQIAALQKALLKK